MSPTKSKHNRLRLFYLHKKTKSQQKLQRRLAQAKKEKSDLAAKQQRLARNVPRTLDNTRELDPSTEIPRLIDPCLSEPPLGESAADADSDPCISPKILVTTSPKATKATYDFCTELVGVFPGAEFVPRKQRKEFQIGRIAGWASGRGYKHLCIVNEDMKQPNAMTLIRLPDGPTARFKLTSIELTRQIFGHARATPHDPELILNNFVTRLGQAVGRLFQTLFPPIPEFQGRQVVTLHNQRDFLFFRRHRYTFRSAEKVTLQEIGPRFTLKLHSLMTGIPAIKKVDRNAKLEMGNEDHEDLQEGTSPSNENEYLWKWKPKIDTRRTFFL